MTSSTVGMPLSDTSSKHLATDSDTEYDAAKASEKSCHTSTAVISHSASFWTKNNDLFYKLVQELMINDTEPGQVLPGLWIGSVGAVADITKLEQKGITHVLSMAEEVSMDCEEDGEGEGEDEDNGLSSGQAQGMSKNGKKPLVFQLVPLDDTEQQLISERDRITTVNFIADAIDSGGGVIVHCFAGISRSSAAVAMYLMYKRKMRLDDALNLIREARPEAAPNEGFMKQLRLMEKDCFSIKSHTNQPFDEDYNNPQIFSSPALKKKDDSLDYNNLNSVSNPELFQKKTSVPASSLTKNPASSVKKNRPFPVIWPKSMFTGFKLKNSKENLKSSAQGQDAKDSKDTKDSKDAKRKKYFWDLKS